MLTKEQRLEVENKVLRYVISRVERAVAKLDGEASEDVLDDIAVVVFKARLEAAVDYHDYLKRELDFAEYLLQESPEMDWEEYIKRKNQAGAKSPGN